MLAQMKREPSGKLIQRKGHKEERKDEKGKTWKNEQRKNYTETSQQKLKGK